MQLRPPRRRDRFLHRLPHQLVPEFERVTRARQRTSGEALLDRRGRIGGDRCEQGHRHPLADDRGDVEHAARARSQPCRPGEGGVTHRRREAAAGGDRLRDQKRIAAGQAHQLGDSGPGRPGQLGHGLRREWLQIEPFGEGARDQVADEHGRVRVGGDLVGAVGRDHAHLAALDVAREQAKDVDRGRVGPVDVLDDEHDRPPPAGGVEQGSHEREAVEGLTGREVGAPGQRGQLPHGAERDRHRQRLACRRQDRRGGGSLGQCAYQRRLARAGLAPDQERPPVPARDRCRERLQRRQLGLAFEQSFHLTPSLRWHNRARHPAEAAAAVSLDRAAWCAPRRAGSRRRAASR